MEQVTVSKEQLDQLIAQNKELKKEVREMYDGTIKLLDTLGLVKDNVIKPEYFNGEENPLPEILKSAGSIITLATQANMPIPVLAKKAEAKLVDKFSFFKELMPIFIKYGKEFYNGK
jgi:hypothetical protein